MCPYHFFRVGNFKLTISIRWFFFRVWGICSVKTGRRTGGGQVLFWIQRVGCNAGCQRVISVCGRHQMKILTASESTFRVRARAVTQVVKRRRGAAHSGNFNRAATNGRWHLPWWWWKKSIIYYYNLRHI